MNGFNINICIRHLQSHVLQSIVGGHFVCNVKRWHKVWLVYSLGRAEQSTLISWLYTSKQQKVILLLMH